jgi:hypothetical protein
MGGMHIGCGPSAFAVEALKAELMERNTAANRTILTVAFFMVIFSPGTGTACVYESRRGLRSPNKIAVFMPFSGFGTDFFVCSKMGKWPLARRPGARVAGNLRQISRTSALVSHESPCAQRSYEGSNEVTLLGGNNRPDG